MSEVTRVPLQPVGKGALVKLWLGIGGAIALAAGTAWAGAPQTIDVDTLTAGSGEMPGATDIVLINYKGTLKDGTVFDQAQGQALPLDSVVPGFSQGVQRMQKGGKYRLTIPSELGYGAEARGPIPANSDLVFEIDLIDFITQERFQDLQRQQQQMLQQMQQQQGGAGAPPGAPAGPPPGAPVPGGR